MVIFHNYVTGNLPVVSGYCIKIFTAAGFAGSRNEGPFESEMPVVSALGLSENQRIA
jgi:hypothetical protein